MDVESGVETGNHGHYMMFTLEQENKKMSLCRKTKPLRMRVKTQ